jgi:hypothetical protein
MQSLLILVLMVTANSAAVAQSAMIWDRFSGGGSTFLEQCNNVSAGAVTACTINLVNANIAPDKDSNGVACDAWGLDSVDGPYQNTLTFNRRLGSST